MGLRGEDCQNMKARTGQLGQDKEMGQPWQDIWDKTAETRTFGQDSQGSSVSIGKPDRSDWMSEFEQDRADRTARP
jgi:hypothetical protein